MILVVVHHTVILTVCKLEPFMLTVCLLCRMLGVPATEVSLPLILPYLLCTVRHCALEWHVTVRVRLRALAGLYDLHGLEATIHTAACSDLWLALLLVFVGFSHSRYTTRGVAPTEAADLCGVCRVGAL